MSNDIRKIRTTVAGYLKSEDAKILEEGEKLLKSLMDGVPVSFPDDKTRDLVMGAVDQYNQQKALKEPILQSFKLEEDYVRIRVNYDFD